MRSGELARRAGVNVETLRYYERRGLLPEPARRPSGYREYPPEALDRLRAIKRAQRLGFTLTEIDALLGPRGRRPTAAVQATAAAKLTELDERARDLEDMRAELRLLVDLECDALVGCSCRRDDCPVAHDERVTRAGAAAVAAPRGTPAAWFAAGLAAVACLACLLPLLGVGAVSAAFAEATLGWEASERVGVVVAAVLVTWWVLQRRAARSRA